MAIEIQRDPFTQLQWGRTSMSAETFNKTLRHVNIHRASMGPHFNGCGNFEAPPRITFVPQLQWGRTSMSAETRKYHGPPVRWVQASMGPHFNKCGNYCTPGWVPWFSPWLQWGRTSMSAETVQAPDNDVRVREASMGPHFNECGNCPASGFPGGERWCFNGAALQPVRKLTVSAPIETALPWLRWGRT